MKRRSLELLSPAADAEIALQAILHGADAVYIGPPSHGARKSASNSLADIEKVVDFAHQFRAKVYATVNTIVYEEEIKDVERLIRDLYIIGVDAIIVQDMSVLRMKIPPISLHASTQCDIRTPEKARFLQEVGFSQLVLARELTLIEIKNISEAVTIPIETFVHGALCVSYSGRCHASLAVTGRSANRGECAQICRLPYTLTDANGNVLVKDKYLLSLKDFNASRNLKDLIDAGVSSFKIEGRLKDAGYVKNITALYNAQLNTIISQNEDRLKRSSFGKVSINFSPKADKSFNRGFSNYFLTERKPSNIVGLYSPKSQGELIKNVAELNNGDGISFYDKNGNFTGVNINRVEGKRIITARKVDIPANTLIYRTSDLKWNNLMKGDTAKRKIAVDIEITPEFVKARDERGLEVIIPNTLHPERAIKPSDYRNVFEKLGATPYYLRTFKSKLSSDTFYRISEVTDLRRKVIELLNRCNLATYPYEYRRKENFDAKYPLSKLDYKDNVANSSAVQFYKDHQVEDFQYAAEVTKSFEKGDVVMTTRHCVLRELGMCIKELKGKGQPFRLPLYLNYDGGKFLLDFDCGNCEMQVKLPK